MDESSKESSGKRQSQEPEAAKPRTKHVAAKYLLAFPPAPRPPIKLPHLVNSRRKCARPAPPARARSRSCGRRSLTATR